MEEYEEMLKDKATPVLKETADRIPGTAYSADVCVDGPYDVELAAATFL